MFVCFGVFSCVFLSGYCCFFDGCLWLTVLLCLIIVVGGGGGSGGGGGGDVFVVCMRACVRACVRACLRACMCVCVLLIGVFVPFYSFY